jgi:hypothetical protein
MAAAFVLEGAHWALNPGQHAAQQILLHSLGFYVAAAAARTASGGGSTITSSSSSSIKGSGSSLGGWDAAAAVDLHGFSLSGAGYHCLAQEGGLTVVLRPAGTAGSAL